MKTLVKRIIKRKNEKNLEKLLEILTSLNTEVTFKPKKTNSFHIYSNLGYKRLYSLSLPKSVSFIQNPMCTTFHYGFVLIKYKHKEYTIFGKGFEGAYLIND